MWKTILRRVLLMLPQIFILSVLAFLIAKMMPGDPFTGLITPETDPNTIEALRVKAGFYDPLPVQYWNWISKAFRGDFGQSYTYKYEVTKLIGERIGNTVWLSLLTLILTYLIALPLGMIAGRFPNSWICRFRCSCWNTWLLCKQIPSHDFTSVYDGDSFNYWYDSILTYWGYRCEEPRLRSYSTCERGS